MAHECPDCGLLCHCGGDIADCCDNFEANVMKCTHYKECWILSDNDEDSYECERYGTLP